MKDSRDLRMRATGRRVSRMNREELDRRVDEYLRELERREEFDRMKRSMEADHGHSVPDSAVIKKMFTG